MSRINTNIPSLVAQRVLTTQNEALNQSLTRLSTGLRINSGKDDPAGLIASETLRSEKVAIQAALTNISRANNVIATAEGGLVEINSLLTDLEDLLDRSANEAAISDEEREANQLQIDAILASIDRFANTTEFQGKKLLNGELDYDLSSVTATDLTSVRVNQAKLPGSGSRDVTVEVTQSAQVAQVDYTGGAVANNSVTIEVVGNQGSEVLTFAVGTTVSQMANAVLTSKDQTGISAAVNGGTLELFSTDYGAEQFVDVNVLDDADSQYTLSSGDGGAGKDYGRNANVLINGTQAITEGLTASIRSAALSVDIDLAEAFNTAGSTTFNVVGGGADFMISPTISYAGQTSLGIQSVSTGNLGKTSLGFLSSIATGQANALSTGNFSAAQEILRESQQQISILRGRLGAFQKTTLDPTTNALRVTYENTTAAESTIRDTDFASETAALTRSQILVQSATNTLRLANSNPQNALALLG